MVPAVIAGATHVLGSPKNWDKGTHGACGSLAVRIHDGVYASAWRPTPEELDLLKSGGVVTIYAVGGMPALALSVESAAERVC